MFHDLDTRLEVTPNRNLGLGGFIVLGNDFNYSEKGRWGFNGRYTLGHAVVRAEYAQAKDGTSQSHGFTTEVGYWITENLEPVVRYETFSQNQTTTISGRAETIGVNYYFRDYFTKIQLAGSALKNMAAINGSPTIAQGVSNQEVTFAVQAAI